jgi:hypothetical protein
MGKSLFKRLEASIIFIFWVAVVLGVIWWMLPSSLTDPINYQVQYDVSRDHLFLTPMPHDCDFDKAPLGNKECHFKKVVTVGHNDANLPYKVTDVYISWEKVQN